MNTRPLNMKESHNLALLNAAGIESVPLFLTATGYRKAICDATDSMRVFLLKHSIHDFSSQGQGLDNKIIRQIQFLTEDGIRFMNMSLYRPVTKRGDPRFWVHGWKRFIHPDSVLVFFYDSDSLCAVNLSSVNLAAPFVSAYLLRHAEQTARIALELLAKLRGLAGTPLPATCEGDTAIGRAVETALDIPINSSKNPDYKGIELKSKRRQSATRNGLFAQVPDFTISPVTNFGEFLNRFGYEHDGRYLLNCTVSTQKVNSQGLILSLSDMDRVLWERHRQATSDEKIFVWPMEKLENRLKEKHQETFWIKADSKRDHTGREWFTLKSVMHTSNPNIPQFSRLLSDGSITVDHMIKRLSSGSVKERGPQFKIKSAKLPELFLGEPKEYSLTD